RTGPQTRRTGSRSPLPLATPLPECTRSAGRTSDGSPALLGLGWNQSPSMPTRVRQGVIRRPLAGWRTKDGKDGLPHEEGTANSGMPPNRLPLYGEPNRDRLTLLRSQRRWEIPRPKGKPSAALIEALLGEVSWLLSHADALTLYRRPEQAAEEYARAALCEEQVACLLEGDGQDLDAAIHRVSAASCYEKLGQYARA